MLTWGRDRRVCRKRARGASAQTQAHHLCLFRLLTPLAVTHGQGRLVAQAHEVAEQGRTRVEADGPCNRPDLDARAEQQVFGEIDPQLDDLLQWRLAEGGAKGATEMEQRHVRCRGQLRQMQFLEIARMDQVTGGVEAAQTGLATCRHGARAGRADIGERCSGMPRHDL